MKHNNQFTVLSAAEAAETNGGTGLLNCLPGNLISCEHGKINIHLGGLVSILCTTLRLDVKASIWIPRVHGASC